MYKIEKDIPIPSLNRVRTKYPYADMSVGDSFVIPEKKRAGCIASARQWGMRQEPERLFSSRLVDKNVVRIWRIK